jgi:hypothetical protein
MRSLSLRTRCATASTRASAAAAACDAPALADCAARAPLERAERALEERDRLALDFVPLDFALLDFLRLDFVPPDLLLPEPPDELPALEPLLLAWGIPSSLCNGPAHPTRRRRCWPGVASWVHARVPVVFLRALNARAWTFDKLPVCARNAREMARMSQHLGCAVAERRV